MRVEFRWCPGCSVQTLFEQPPCEDGHGADCLDLACMECGFGITLRDLNLGDLNLGDLNLGDVTPARQARKDSSAA